MKAALVLLLAAAAVTAVAASEPEDPNAARSCLPCRDEDENASCPPLDASQCQSGRTMKCGCCDACVIILEEGQQCRFFVQTNEVCGEGLVCSGSGQCETPQKRRR